MTFCCYYVVYGSEISAKDLVEFLHKYKFLTIENLTALNDLEATWHEYWDDHDHIYAELVGSEGLYDSFYNLNDQKLIVREYTHDTGKENRYVIGTKLGELELGKQFDGSICFQTSILPVDLQNAKLHFMQNDCACCS